MEECSGHQPPLAAGYKVQWIIVHLCVRVRAGVCVGVNEVNEVFRWFRWLQAPEELVWPQPVCRLLLQLPPQNQRGPRHPTCDYLL